MGTLVWDSKGRPMVQCPVCGRVHAVLRRQDYLNQATIRFHCRNHECKSTWIATPEEKQKLADHFEVHQAKKKTPKQKPPESASTNSPPAPKSEEGKSKKTIWDFLA